MAPVAILPSNNMRASQRWGTPDSPTSPQQPSSDHQRSLSPSPSPSPRQHPAHKTDWEHVVLTPRGSAPSTAFAAASEREPSNQSNQVNNGTRNQRGHQVELSPRAQQASMGNISHRGDWEPVVLADRRTIERQAHVQSQPHPHRQPPSNSVAANNDDALTEHSLALGAAAAQTQPHEQTQMQAIRGLPGAQGAAQHNSSMYSPINSPINSRMSGTPIGSDTGSLQPFKPDEHFSTMSNRTAEQQGLRRISVPSAHSAMSATSPKGQSPNFTLKRDAAVQYEGLDSPPGKARQNPLFEVGSVHRDVLVGPNSPQRYTAQHEYAAPQQAPRGAPRDVEVQYGGQDSPPRRKGPQPSGHRLGKMNRQDDDDTPSFKQMYSPTNPPEDTGTWTPRGKGFVTII